MPDDRAGLDAVAADVNREAANAEAAEESALAPPVAVVSQQELDAESCAGLVMHGLDMGAGYCARRFDPMLPAIGAAEGSTFALSEDERNEIKREIVRALMELPPDWLKAGHPFVTLPVVLLGLVIPRIVWAVQIRRLAADAGEAESGSTGSGGGGKGVGQD